MKKSLRIFLVIALTTMLQSCYFSFNTVGSWRNKTIDQDLRDEIAPINKNLFKDIMTGNVKGVKKLMSEALLNQSKKRIDTIINTFGPTFKAVNYKVLDEFYIKNINDVKDAVLKSDHENDTDYKLEFVAINKQTYVSVMVSTGLPVNCLILAIYGKYGNGWKLNLLQMGEYSVLDQTAPDYYNVATTQLGNGNYIDAANMIYLASQIAHPAGRYFVYMNDYEMKDTYSIIIKQAEAQYHFPLVISQIKSQPQIFNVGPQLIENGQPHGVLPMIKYKTTIPLKDTVALRAENKEIQKAISAVFHGIDKNKPGIVYRAFNQIPDSVKTFDYYQYIQTIKYSTHY